MDWFSALFGGMLKGKVWDGSERRLSFRVKCDFELELQLPGNRYLAQVVDAGPQGLKMRVRGPYIAKILKSGALLQLRYVEPVYGAELDTVGGEIRWVKREGEQLFTLAVALKDSLENLKRSWVKPVLQKVFKTVSRKNLRDTMRAKCNLPARLTIEKRTLDIKVNDLSTTGARVACLVGLTIGDIAELEVEGLRLRCKVRRCEPEYGVFRVGLAFSSDEKLKPKILTLVKKLVQVNKMVDSV